MFWPQTFLEWIATAAMVFFIIEAFRVFKKDHQEDDVFEPIKYVGKRTLEETRNSPIYLQKITRVWIQGRDRKKR